MNPTEYNKNILKGEEEDGLEAAIITYESLVKRSMEKRAEELTLAASNLRMAASSLCRPSSTRSLSLPGEKSGILTLGKGLEICTNKPKDGSPSLPGEKDGILTSEKGLDMRTNKPKKNVPLVPAFYRARAERNLKPTCADIKRYLAEARESVDDESIQYLLLRVQEKGWQEVSAYHYEQNHSLPPGTGHQLFKVFNKELCYHSHGTFPRDEDDAGPLGKRLKTCSNKPYPVAKEMTHRAYYKAVNEQGIKYPTLSDIKRIIDDLRRSGFADSVGIPDDPIRDEEIEIVRLHIKSSGMYLK